MCVPRSGVNVCVCGSVCLCVCRVLLDFRNRRTQDAERRSQPGKMPPERLQLWVSQLCSASALLCFACCLFTVVVHKVFFFFCRLLCWLASLVTLNWQICELLWQPFAVSANASCLAELSIDSLSARLVCMPNKFRVGECWCVCVLELSLTGHCLHSASASSSIMKMSSGQTHCVSLICVLACLSRT